MNKSLNHILTKNNNAYWNEEIFTKLCEDFKVNYKNNPSLYDEFIHIFEFSKNYIEKVRVMMKHFMYLWSANNSIISDKECNTIWKTYHSFTHEEKHIIVNTIKSTITEITDIIDKNKSQIKNSINDKKKLENELNEAKDKIEELTTKFSALMDVYNNETQDKKQLMEKYSKLEKDYYILSSSYSETYRISEFRGQRIEDLVELNNRLKNAIEELRSSRDLYRDLYAKNAN